MLVWVQLPSRVLMGLFGIKSEGPFFISAKTRAGAYFFKDGVNTRR